MFSDKKNTEFNKIWNETMEFSALVIYFFSTMNPSLSLSYYLMIKPLYDFNADMIPCDLLFVLMNWIKTTITLNNVKFLLMTVEDSGRLLICKSA